MKRRMYLILMMTLILFNGTSCDYRAIEDMPMVIGLGIDMKDEHYLLTAKIIVPTTGSQGSSSSKQTLIQTEGDTVFDAARDFILKEGQKVFWGQLDYIVVSYPVAQDQMTAVLDFFMRDDEIREDIYLIVAGEGYSAEEVLKSSTGFDEMRLYVLDVMENAQYIGKYDPLLLVDFNLMCISPGIEPVIPLIEIEKRLNEERIIINGCVVFKDRKPVGIIRGTDTQYFRMIQGRSGIGVLVFDYKNEDNQTSKVTYEVGNSKSKTKIKKDGQMFKVEVEVKLTGTIAEVMDNNVLKLDVAGVEDFKKQAKKELEKDLNEFVDKIKEGYGSDIFGFGEKVKDQYPKDFKQMDNQWNDVFSVTPVDITVDVSVIGSSLIKNDLYEGE